VLQTSC